MLTTTLGARIRARKLRSVLRTLMVTLLLVSGACCASSIGTVPPLDNGALLRSFESPPESARPRVWWHWMNGNVTRSGIREDLKWMHGIGVGGINVISAGLAAPHLVKPPVRYMTPAWKSDFSLAARLAGRYGMKVSIDSAPGWSEAGGTWVKPSQAMKKLVWSATVVQGGKPFHGVLPKPPANTGPFLNAPMGRKAKFARLKFYQDSVVIAYNAPVLDPKPISGTSSSGSVGPHLLSELSDGSLTDGTTLTAVNGEASMILQYARPVRLQGATLAATSSASNLAARGVTAAVYVSNNGTSWKAVTKLGTKNSYYWNGEMFPQVTVSFAPIVVRYVRVILTSSSPQTIHTTSKSPLQFHVHELVLHSRATVNRFAAKAYFAIAPEYYALASKSPVAPGTAVKAKGVVNLTHLMKPDGDLDWSPPPGHWIVLRMGYSLEGTANHPAPPSATGLEVDKLNRKDVKSYVTHYLHMYQAITGPFDRPGSITAMTNDSTEVGMQNWTNHFLEDFKRMNGYSAIPWLPTLTGVVVGSSAQSDRFLWDFRHTINELLATNFYKETAELAHARGLRTYGEALEYGRRTFGDGMRMRQYASVPMGAMWTFGRRGKPFPSYVADLRGAASVADIYGSSLVAAESMTSANQPWRFAPQELKPVVDEEFVLGANRIFIHQSAEQPFDRPPGLPFSIYGQNFSRLDTWAADARPWIRYMARCSFLLQQGRHVTDIAYFYGQGAPITGLFMHKPIDVPHGYGFDFFDANALLHKLSIKGGRLATRSGMRYRVLFLGGSSRHMTLNVLRRVDQLVREGARVVGRRPVGSPSLKINPEEYRKITTALFGPPGSTNERRVGAGLVFPSGSLPKALKALHIRPDFVYSKPDSEPESDAVLKFTHRKLAHGDIYFVSNQRDHPVRVTATFRVAGRTPELWNPVTRMVDPVSYKIADGRTSIRLDLPAYGSIFVVFRKVAKHASESVAEVQPKTLLTLHGPWKVTFQTRRGAPAQIEMQHLTSWSKSPSAGVKYFSGTGTYHKTFRLPMRQAGTRLLLDLGKVWELAKVSVNGKPVRLVWTPPFQVDITNYVHPGKNALSIAVTNLWVNRLIGDAQPGVKKKYTFTVTPMYKPDAPLRVSGLLGPVRIEQVVSPSSGQAASTRRFSGAGSHH